MKHLQNQTNNQQKSSGLRQALNREVNIPGHVRHGTIRAPRPVSALTL
jgi:hypothetical protein